MCLQFTLHQKRQSNTVLSPPEKEKKILFYKRLFNYFFFTYKSYFFLKKNDHVDLKLGQKITKIYLKIVPN